MHPCLAKQLDQVYGIGSSPPHASAELLKLVSETYEAAGLDENGHLPAARQSTSLQELESLVEHRTAALHHAMELAEAANRAKSAFLANMSHEIRTPMAAILGFADMLLSEQCSPLQRIQHVQTIRHQGEHLLTLLNDVLDLSKIEANKLEIETISCDPVQIVEDVLLLTRGRAAEKQLRCEAFFTGPIPVAVQTDPTRLRQILINLLGNAVKFTGVGGVQVVVSMTPVKLADAGRPGPKRMRFEVIDSGVGINAEQLTTLFEPFAQGDSSITRRYGGTGLGLSICKRLAQMLGGDISVTSMPGCGSRFVVEIDPGPLDQVLHTLRVPTTEPLPSLSTPSHPVVPETPRPATTVAPVPAGSKQRPGLTGRALLVDDGIHNQRVITYYLEKVGLQVTVAGDGVEGCRHALDAMSAGRPFGVILMDMQMPEMDGYQATAKLRAAGYTKPIIAITANAMSSDRAKCLSVGCDDYLTKPVNTKELFALLVRTLQDSPPPQQTASTAALPPVPAPAVSVTEILSDSDDPVVAHFLPAFVADLPAQIDELLRCRREADLAALGDALHSLKGSCGMYGFPTVSEAAAVAESRCTDAIGDAAEAALQELIRLLRAVKPVLQTAQSAEPSAERGGVPCRPC